MAKFQVSIRMKGEIVDEGNGFYYRVKPRVKTGAARLEDKDVRDIIDSTRKKIQKKFKGMKL